MLFKLIKMSPWNDSLEKKCLSLGNTITPYIIMYAIDHYQNKNKTIVNITDEESREAFDLLLNGLP